MKFPTFFRWRIHQKYFQVGIYLFTLLHLIEIRRDLDHKHTFITSDGQIKYYQTLQMAQGEFRNSECLYPGLELDPEYRFYLFDYPWAFFGVNGMKCAFQYSPYFPWVSSAFSNALGEWMITYVPLVFWFFCILVFDSILRRINVRAWLVGVLSISLFFCSFLSLSALDYAELSLNDLIALLGILGIAKFLHLVWNESTLVHKLHPWKSYAWLVLGVIGLSSSILLRPEGIVPIGIMVLLAGFLFREKLFYQITDLMFWVSIILPGVLVLLGFLYVNHVYSGNPLGFRASNTGNDMKELYELSNVWNGFVSDLWKSDFKSGLFFAVPAIFLFPPIVLFLLRRFQVPKEFNLFQYKIGCTFLYSGLMSCLLIPIFSPYRAGYHHFGNRYFEVAVILVFLGIGILWNEVLNRIQSGESSKKRLIFTGFIPFLILIVFLTNTYYSLRYTKEGWNVLKNSAVLYSQMQDKLNEIGEKPGSDQRIPIVHKSLFTAYLVGESFLDRAQFRVIGFEEMRELEAIFREAGIEEYMTIEFLGQPRYMSDIPRNQYDEKINIKYESPSDRFREVKAEDFLEFRLSRRERK